LSLVGGWEGASAGYRVNRAINGDFADARVSQVRYVEVASAIYCDPIGLIELSRGGWSAVASETRRSCSREGLDASIGRDSPHTVRCRVGKVDVSRIVEGDSLGLAQRG